jgi:hypothetical protein
MVASSQPSHQERQIEREANSRSRVARSRRAGNCTTAAAGMAASRRQRSASTTVVPPPLAATEVMLVVAHQLLNNPPPLHTSPSMVEQWQNEINQLIIAAINMPPHRGR